MQRLRDINETRLKLIISNLRIFNIGDLKKQQNYFWQLDTALWIRYYNGN